MVKNNVQRYLLHFIPCSDSQRDGSTPISNLLYHSNSNGDNQALNDVKLATILLPSNLPGQPNNRITTTPTIANAEPLNRRKICFSCKNSPASNTVINTSSRLTAIT